MAGVAGLRTRGARGAQGIVFVVHRAEIEYRLPARLGDRLDATLSSSNSAARAWSHCSRCGAATSLLTHARVTLACVDRATLRPARIPAPLHARLEDPA